MIKFRKVVKRNVEFHVFAGIFGVLNKTKINTQDHCGIDKVAITSDGYFYAYDAYAKATHKAVIDPQAVGAFITFFNVVEATLTNDKDANYTLDIVTYSVDGSDDYVLTWGCLVLNGVIMTVEGDVQHKLS